MLNTPDFGFADFEISGKNCSGQGDKHHQALSHIRRTTDDLVYFITYLHLADREFVGVWMFVG